MEYLDGLVNFEQRGVPRGAGSGSDAACQFDLRRMHGLLSQLGDPHHCWPVIHVAGSKGGGTHGSQVQGAGSHPCF